MNCYLSARMIMQPAPHDFSQALLQGSQGFLVTLNGRTVKQLKAVGISGWVSTTIGADFSQTLLCHL